MWISLESPPWVGHRTLLTEIGKGTWRTDRSDGLFTNTSCLLPAGFIIDNWRGNLESLVVVLIPDIKSAKCCKMSRAEMAEALDNGFRIQKQTGWRQISSIILAKPMEKKTSLVILGLLSIFYSLNKPLASSLTHPENFNLLEFLSGWISFRKKKTPSEWISLLKLSTLLAVLKMLCFRVLTETVWLRIMPKLSAMKIWCLTNPLGWPHTHTHKHKQTQTKLNTPEESRQGWQRQVWDLIERFVSCYLIGRPLQAGGYRLMKFTCCCASDWSSNQPRRRCYPYVQRLGCSAVEWARAGAFPFGGADLTIENRPGCHSERARQQSARSG